MNLRNVRKAAREQGWTEKPTRDGWFWISPDGLLKVAVHRDPPEHSLMKAVGRMRRHGFQWPPPKK